MGQVIYPLPGIALAAPPAWLPPVAPPGINVCGVKIIGATNSANVTVGPTVIWGLDSLSKGSQITSLAGDFSYGPMGYSVLVDNDIYDSPMIQWGTV